MKKAYSELGFKKYQSLIISISILILLIVLVLSLNLFLSNTIRLGGNTISVASSQSSLINQISKDLFLINSRFTQDMSITSERRELRLAIDRFDQVLDAFANGGMIETNDETDTEKLPIEKLEGADSELIIFEALKIWGWYEESVDSVFDELTPNGGQLLNARDISERYTSRLAALMNVMSSRVQTKIEKNIQYLEIIQYIGIGLTALMLCWTIFVVIRNLRKNDIELDIAREEASGILSAVQEGLFLLDNNFTIGSEHSKEVEAIFETPDIAGQSFLEIIERINTNVETYVLMEFLDLLFDSSKVENLIQVLNPMDDIVLSFNKDNGSIIEKHLGFSFHRVKSGKDIVNVLVSVKDTSENYFLKQKLEESKKSGTFEKEALSIFSESNPQVINDFFIATKKTFNAVNSILQKPVSNRNSFKKKANAIFVEIHRIKGEASSLQLDSFSSQLHDFENSLSDIKKIDDVEGLDFLPLAVHLDSLISYSDEFSEFTQKMSHKFTTGSVKPIHTNQWNHLSEFVSKTATELDKKVEIITTGLHEANLSKKQIDLINSCCIQLIRNAIVHGIETPDERIKANKKETARIDLRVSSLSGNVIEIIVRDDGRGFDLDSIRHKIIQSGNDSPDSVAQWSPNKLISKVFESGFSTAKETNIYAGRGVGLDVVKKDIQSLNGHLRISQIFGKFCQFEITLPLETTSQVSNSSNQGYLNAV